jgi:hypothetical protein
MNRAETIVAEAALNDGRVIAPERAAELACELETLRAVSRKLGARLRISDQASDFKQALIDTSVPPAR